MRAQSQCPELAWILPVYKVQKVTIVLANQWVEVSLLRSTEESQESHPTEDAPLHYERQFNSVSPPV